MELRDSYKSFLDLKNDFNTNNDEQNSPDNRSGSLYYYDHNLLLATETAIVTQRPLLLRGDPGSGKSSFAPFVARNLDWCYYEATITGRTESKDLLWKFDNLARLRDAQANSRNIKPSKYITPGVLWYAFNRKDALNFINQQKKDLFESDRQDISFSENFELSSNENQLRDKNRSVILIDEIDKADPDLPNDLLEVLSINSFNVDELNGYRVKRELPESPNNFGSLLIIITTNQERELPAAFLRRCIVHTLEDPWDKDFRVDRLVNIAMLHMKNQLESNLIDLTMIKSIAEKCYDLQVESKSNLRRIPSTAEFLDLVKVCYNLKIDINSNLWNLIARNVFIK